MSVDMQLKFTKTTMIINSTKKRKEGEVLKKGLIERPSTAGIINIY
jgi:hypothetical protein